MAKKAIVVDRYKLEQAIKQAEKGGPLANRSKLWEAVAEIYNKDATTPITPSVVYLRVQEFKLTVQTPVGKKGRAAMSPEQIAAMQAARGKRVPKAEKFAADPKISEALDCLQNDVPERFQPLVVKVRAGSRGAALKLKCLECSAWQTGEVRQCPVNDCALWAFRPYQKADSDEAEEGEGEEEAA